MAHFDTVIPALEAAYGRGHVYLVDAQGARLNLPLSAALRHPGRVWAHLCDHVDGEWYVEPLLQAADLCQPRYHSFFE